MEKQAIEVEGQFFEIPDYVQPNKIEEFKEYLKVRIEWDNIDKTFELPNGVVVTFPRVNAKHKQYVASLDEKLQMEFYAKRDMVQNQLVKLMRAKVKVSKKSRADVKMEMNNQTSRILELLGQDYSVSEVHKILWRDKINIPYPSLLRFAKRNEEKIRELRNNWREDIQDVSISIKRSRLEKLNYLLNDLLQNYDNATPLNRIPYSKEIRGILEQARKEVEGEEIKLTVSGRIDVEATIASYINESHLLRDLTIHQIVISRVAARMGIASGAIIDRLANSFYNKFNGFRSNNDLSTKILYPSAVNYDILDLQEKNKALEQKVFEAPSLEVKNYQTKARMNINRDKLNKKIEQLLSNTEKVKKSI